MTLGDYYKLKHGAGATPANVLNNIHRKALSRLNGQSTVAQCQKLQDYFNRVFYPEVYGGSKHDEALNQHIKLLIEQAYQQKYDAALNNFSMGASQVTYGIKDMPGIIREKYEEFDHKKRIYFGTIQKRLEKTEQALANISMDSRGADELTKMEKDLIQLRQSLQDLLALQTDSNEKVLHLENNQNLLDQVRAMDVMYQSLSHLDGIFQPEDYGQILEWVLQAFDAEADPIIDDITDGLTDEMLEKMTHTAGSTTTGRGFDDAITVGLADITVDGKTVKQYKKPNSKGKEETYMSIGSGKSKFEFRYLRDFNPDSTRQGKMDVNFHFSDEGKLIPFRISAKNWDTLKRDFGSASIAFALLRTVGNDATTGYIYTMGDKQALSSWKHDYHKVAQYSLLLDILMGYSQLNHYADTIFINMRSKKMIIVASISDILDRINNDLDSWNIGDNYSKRTIESNLQSIRKAISSRKIKNKSHEVEALSLKYLQATQVKLRYAVIQRYIVTQPTVAF